MRTPVTFVSLRLTGFASGPPSRLTPDAHPPSIATTAQAANNLTSVMISPLSNGGCAADDFRKFLGDAGLPVLVVDQCQLVDQVARVVGGGLHRHHARR